MMRDIVMVYIVLGISTPVVADNQQQLTGFGSVQWGMTREAIVAKEGLPGIMDDVNGTIWYLDKNVMGKRAETIYNFEKGCTELASSVCRFADGYHSFKDRSKAYADKLEQMLTEQYGKPSEITTQHEAGKSTNFLASGKKEQQHTMTVRRVGKVKIVHTVTVNLHEYTNFAGEIHKAGPVGNRVHYYGPYHYGKNVQTVPNSEE